MDNNLLDDEYSRRRANFLPWEPHSAQALVLQSSYHELLRRRAGAKFFGKNCFISPDAHIYTDMFRIGDNAYIASGAVLRGNITIGSNCSVNCFAQIAGSVTIGNGVRIASLVSICGFNHGFDRVDIPIWQQKVTFRGVEIGDGTWIGSPPP
jgi:acetyltransferase-like isoleucine patch superfamily enzyme